MTAPAKPTIDEQIAFARIVFGKGPLSPAAEAILATLEAHKRITEAAGRPEPVAVKVMRDENSQTHDPETVAYIDALLAYADRVAAERDALRVKLDNKQRTLERYQEEAAELMDEAALLGRAETAERQLAKCQKECEEQARLNGMGSEREARLMAQLAELQKKMERMVEPQNPCNCVPDGDDGTVAHLCHWHKATLGKAYRMQNMANSLTIENIAKLPQDRLRLWIAHGIQESTARKRAEEQLAELQAKHDALVAMTSAVCEKDPVGCWRVRCHLGKDCAANKELLAAMSDVALGKGGE